MVTTTELTKRFGRRTALSKLTLEVPEGSVFAFVGPNGAGKSTALKTVFNVLRPTSGEATVLGRDSRRIGVEEWRQIGYVSESQQLPEWMTVARFLAYCREMYPNWHDEEARALARDLPHDRKLHQLSRGMKVKAALASSLAYRPKLLVLDEPFSGLDVLVREELIETILLRTPELTVLIASHDLAEIESFASHVAYLEDGRLRFVEENSALSQRFRLVEITFEGEAPPPAGLPPEWLHAQAAGGVLRFIDSRFDRARTAAEIRSRFDNVRSVDFHYMGLRAIFVALARRASR